MDPMVGSSVVSDGAISDSSDNAALLDFCFLCSRQFFHNNLDNYGTERLKAEDILETFFEELGPVDRALLQCCPSCQTLCKTLARTKEALSSLIDEITNLLLRSRKVSYLLSKSRVVSRLFQSSNISLPPCEVSSSYLQQPLSQMNFSKDISNNNSNSCFPTQFNLRLDSSNMSEENQLDLGLSHSNASSIVRKSSPFKTRNKSHCSSQELSSTCASAFNSIYNDSIMNSVSDNACDISEEVHQSQHTYKIMDMDPQKTSTEENCRESDPTNVESSILKISQQSNELAINGSRVGIHENTRERETEENRDTLVHTVTKSLTEPVISSKAISAQNSIICDDSNNQKSMKPKKTETRFKCVACNKCFQNARNLKCHMSAHCEERKFVCEMCGASYRHKAGLDSHVAIHKGGPKFQCDICFKTFSQNIGLQRHLRIHTKKFQYVCDTCGKQFLHHTSFAAHKLIHTGIKDFSCTHCGLTFAQKSNLQRHLKIHSGEKPHSCSLCGRSFSQRYNLVAHLQSHDEDSSKSHKCSICTKTYTRKFKLKQHMKHIHGLVT